MSGLSPRFGTWAAFLIFSTITMASVVQVLRKNNIQQKNSSQNWAIACSAITFCTTLIVVVMHLHATASTMIVGTKIEGVISLILVIFWIATVSVVTDSEYGLAVDEEGAVSNGNLYYFSWAGFFCSVKLLVSYLNDVFNVDVGGELKTRSARLTMWSAHLASSLVVMGASANFYDNTCGEGNDEGLKCGRAIFGITLGSISTLLAVSIVGLKIATARAPFLVEAAVSVLLTIFYVFAVAFITSPDGPAAPLGNLYYFTWISFLTAFMLSASCFEDYNAARDMAAEVDNPPEDSNPPVGDDRI